MARPRSKHPTELELLILKVLWRLGPLPVRDVREALVPERDLAYTTVITMMNIMTNKGYLRRKKRGASFVYTPKITENRTAGKMLKDIVDRVFNGSAAAVMVNLLETSELNEAELVKLRKILRQRAKE